MSQFADICIVGNGLVGASLACALRELPLRIVILDSNPALQHFGTDFDARSVALSQGSYRIINGMGIQDDIRSALTAINTIHISDRGHFGRVLVNAAQCAVDALGYVIEVKALTQALQNCLAASTNVKLMCPVTVQDITTNESGTQIKMTTPQGVETIQTSLVIAADGSDSTLRQLVNIDVEKVNYAQSAIIANIGLARDHHFTAYERFTAAGPLALLPLGDKRVALVWTHHQHDVMKFMDLSDNEFLSTLQRTFGWRLGKFEHLGKRHVFPLQMIKAKQQYRGNVLLLGNSAHTLHPIAGQGFNLGLRDVAVIADQVSLSVRNKLALNSSLILENYTKARRDDHKQMLLFTDKVNRIFSTDFFPMVLARNMGLEMVELLPFLKRLLTKRTMGLLTPASTLGCGIGLGSVHE